MRRSSKKADKDVLENYKVQLRSRWADDSDPVCLDGSWSEEDKSDQLVLLEMMEMKSMKPDRNGNDVLPNFERLYRYHQSAQSSSQPYEILEYWGRFLIVAETVRPIKVRDEISSLFQCPIVTSELAQLCLFRGLWESVQWRRLANVIKLSRLLGRELAHGLKRIRLYWQDFVALSERPGLAIPHHLFSRLSGRYPKRCSADRVGIPELIDSFIDISSEAREKMLRYIYETDHRIPTLDLLLTDVSSLADMVSLLEDSLGSCLYHTRNRLDMLLMAARLLWYHKSGHDHVCRSLRALQAEKARAALRVEMTAKTQEIAVSAHWTSECYRDVCIPKIKESQRCIDTFMHRSASEQREIVLSLTTRHRSISSLQGDIWAEQGHLMQHCFLPQHLTFDDNANKSMQLRVVDLVRDYLGCFDLLGTSANSKSSSSVEEVGDGADTSRNPLPPFRREIRGNTASNPAETVVNQIHPRIHTRTSPTLSSTSAALSMKDRVVTDQTPFPVCPTQTKENVASPASSPASTLVDFQRGTSPMMSNNIAASSVKDKIFADQDLLPVSPTKTKENVASPASSSASTLVDFQRGTSPIMSNNSAALSVKDKTFADQDLLPFSSFERADFQGYFSPFTVSKKVVAAPS
ncbi:MAG: hypothetical protein M1816_005000 [Peltula sp. TS41687]|nr:MAG: hypothetical protein M1816_005000 [Peltula sp. TS41687]